MKLRFALFSTFVCILLASCEKVIDLKLDTIDQKVVIEGQILLGDTIQRVRVTMTQPFDQSTNPPAVNNAVVSVTDNFGNIASFTSVGNGWYELQNYEGFENRTYTLNVAVDGKNYSASSTMPQKETLFQLVTQSIPFGMDSMLMMIPAHNDQLGVENYYQFHVYINGIRDKSIYIQNDQLTDGNLMVEAFFVTDLKKGDSLRCDMFCIDKPVYNYFNQLSVNQSSSATPANPVSNFSGGCLGYFSARTFDSKTIKAGQ